MHIYISDLNILDSNNALLAAGWCQAIIRILLIWPLGTQFSEMSIEIHTFLFTKMHVLRSSVKRQPFCPDLKLLKQHQSVPSPVYGCQVHSSFPKSKHTVSWLWAHTPSNPAYCQISNISHTKSQNLNVSCLFLQLSLHNPLKPSAKWEWRCSWSSTDRWFSIYIWVINNFVA